MSHVAVIGGGLAGLAAAVRLAERRHRVTILESRQRLGGRAGSFTDPATGQLVDACQHAAMGCCTEFFRFCRTVGISKFLERQPRLHFLTSDGVRSMFKADPWPAPFHLGRALMSAHYLTPVEKLRVAWGLLCMRLESADADPPLFDWLVKHRQTPRTITRFWGTVLISALNESVERLGFKYARKVFVEGFMNTRDGFEVWLPTVPLGRLYGEELLAWFARHGVEVRLNAAVKRVQVSDNAVSHVEIRDGATVEADEYVLAVPFERAGDLLCRAGREPPRVVGVTRGAHAPARRWHPRPSPASIFGSIGESWTSPMRCSSIALGQWAFDRGGNYVQVVISAARDLDRENLADRIADELRRIFPAARNATVLRSKVVTEHHATFSAIPGIDSLRRPAPSLHQPRSRRVGLKPAGRHDGRRGPQRLRRGCDPRTSMSPRTHRGEPSPHPLRPRTRRQVSPAPLAGNRSPGRSAGKVRRSPRAFGKMPKAAASPSTCSRTRTTWS
ncbi:MAG: hydroxysqualene dehydroxylase HpnE [Gemmataceae bacterium]